MSTISVQFLPGKLSILSFDHLSTSLSYISIFRIVIDKAITIIATVANGPFFQS